MLSTFYELVAAQQVERTEEAHKVGCTRANVSSNIKHCHKKSPDKSNDQCVAIARREAGCQTKSGGWKKAKK